MPAISPDMRKAALIRQDLGRPHVPHSHGRTAFIMAHPAPVVPLPAAELREVTELAVSTYQHGADLIEQGVALLKQSQSLMEETGLLPPALVPAPRLAPVTDLGAFRARRQAVS